MNNPQLIFSLVISLVFTTGILFAQDIHFSQLEFAPNIVNPALAGVRTSSMASIIYKNQWQSITAPYSTIYGSYDQRLKSPEKQNKSKGYFVGGLGFYSDKAGDGNMGITVANLSVGYHLKISENQRLGLALQPGFANRSVSVSSIKWGTQYEQNVGYNASLSNNENVASQSFSFFDLGAGLVYNYGSSERYLTSNDQKLLTVGLAMFHVTQPNYSFIGSANNLYRRYTAFVRGTYGIPNRDFALQPAIYYTRQGNQDELLVGTMIRYTAQQESQITELVKRKSISAGAFLRAQDALACRLVVDYQDFSFGLSYDINLSELTAASQARGGVEIALQYAISEKVWGAFNSN